MTSASHSEAGASPPRHPLNRYEGSPDQPPVARSRYLRPPTPTSKLVLQPRDEAILRLIQDLRFVRSDHLQALLFDGVSLRALQVRLRKLWEHHFLERRYVPFVLGDGMVVAARARQPIYLLAPRGQDYLARRAGDEHHRPKPVGPGAIIHHLIVTDFLVAVLLAQRGHPDLIIETAAPEWPLWQRLQQLPVKPRQLVIPDGVLTMKTKTGERHTIYLEVVRASVKGGNDRLLAKLKRYQELNRAGFFAAAFGHEHLRAVLFVTPSQERADNLRQLASKLQHGQALFWFGSYEELTNAGARASTLTPATILTERWASSDGTLHSLIPSSRVAAAH